MILFIQSFSYLCWSIIYTLQCIYLRYTVWWLRYIYIYIYIYIYTLWSNHHNQVISICTTPHSYHFLPSFLHSFSFLLHFLFFLPLFLSFQMCHLSVTFPYTLASSETVFLAFTLLLVALPHLPQKQNHVLLQITFTGPRLTVPHNSPLPEPPAFTL